MKPLPAFLLSLLLLMPAAAEGRRPARGGRPAPPPPAAPVLDFGTVVPEGGAAFAWAEVFTGAEGPFEVSVQWEGEAEANGRLAAGKLALRCGNGPFLPLRPGPPLPLGTVLAAGGLLRLEGRLALPWEVPPGPFRMDLRLSIGEGWEVPLAARGQAAEVLVLEGAPDRWIPERDLDPSRDRSLSFGSQSLRVRANVPWRLEARIPGGADTRSAALFRWASLLVRLAGGRSEALSPGHPSDLGRGGPTPPAGFPLAVEPLLVFTGLPEEGSLDLPLELRLVREASP
ncbi:MAG: hypothetical protein ACP5VN_02455 [Acidobacteriota bacterium]